MAEDIDTEKHAGANKSHRNDIATGGGTSSHKDDISTCGSTN